MIELFKLCVIISPLYFMVYQPICMCALQRDPVSPLTTFIWGSVFFRSNTPNSFSSGLLQEWSKSICLTFVHNIWPRKYSALQLINNATSTRVSLYTEQRNTSSSLPLSRPFHNNEPILSVIYLLAHREKNGLFDHEHDEMWPDLIYCWGNDSQKQASNPPPVLINST